MGVVEKVTTDPKHCLPIAPNRLKREFTVHWLRYTGISDDVKTRPREPVRDDAGHSSSSITDKYIDINLRERHASARRKSIKAVDKQAK